MMCAIDGTVAKSQFDLLEESIAPLVLTISHPVGWNTLLGELQFATLSGAKVVQQDSEISGGNDSDPQQSPKSQHKCDESGWQHTQHSGIEDLPMFSINKVSEHMSWPQDKIASGISYLTLVNRPSGKSASLHLNFINSGGCMSSYPPVTCPEKHLNFTNSEECVFSNSPIICPENRTFEIYILGDALQILLSLVLNR